MDGESPRPDARRADERGDHQTRAGQRIHLETQTPLQGNGRGIRQERAAHGGEETRHGTLHRLRRQPPRHPGDAPQGRIPPRGRPIRPAVLPGRHAMQRLRRGNRAPARPPQAFGHRKLVTAGTRHLHAQVHGTGEDRPDPHERTHRRDQRIRQAEPEITSKRISSTRNTSAKWDSTRTNTTSG